MYQQYRHTTPPSFTGMAMYSQPAAGLHHSVSHPITATTTTNEIDFLSSSNSSPESCLTNITTPDRSPRASCRPNGPTLLPRIRCQDQIIEPVAMCNSIPPQNAARISARTGLPSLYTYALQKPMMGRRSASPSYNGRSGSPASAYSAVTTPASASTTLSTPATALSSAYPNSATSAYALSPCDSLFGASLDSPNQLGANMGLLSAGRSPYGHMRAASASAVPRRVHARSGSVANIDEAALMRHGYPTQYRQMPQYVTAADIAPVQAAPIMSYSHSSESAYAVGESAMPGGPVYAANAAPSTPFPEQTTSIISYLSEANTSPPLTRRLLDTNRFKDWFWWDVRNLRSWSDFSIDAVMSVPQFPELLHVPIDTQLLPHPQRTSQQPETVQNLAKMYEEFYLTKVNAALKETQGPRHMVMSSSGTSTGPKAQPDFISTYDGDIALGTLSGAPRGRLVGLVKAYDQWNTGMRSGRQNVEYLAGLSHLHRVMREHGCRYGFIITEVELLCVRAGARDTQYRPHPNEGNSLDDGPTPVFGWLETATPISLRTCGQDSETSAPQLTAGLALWYLNMLAKEDALPGQAPWKMAVSGVIKYTRRECEDRDTWMPKIGQREMREAKRVRGWVHPQDPPSRKELPSKRRRGTNPA